MTHGEQAPTGPDGGHEPFRSAPPSVVDANMKPQVKVCDVTLRDGMQIVNRDRVIALDMRLRLLEALYRSGLPYLEVGSFVSPRFIPAMQDTPEMLRAMPHMEAEIAVLVPNIRYYRELERHDHEKVNTIALFVSASEAYSESNTRMSKERAFDSAREVAAAARHDGFRLRGYLSYAFREMGGEREMDPEIVRRDSEALLAMGCSTILLSDTDGRSSPRDVERTVDGLRPVVGVEALGVHLHDRWGQGIANALAAYQLGIRAFDSSIGGVGGSKAVESSVGNIATEELISLFHGMGVETGVDPAPLLEAGRLLVEMTELAGDPLPPSKLLANQLSLHQNIPPGWLAAELRAPKPRRRAVEPALDGAEHPAGPPVSLMATMVAVPITFVTISWLISILSIPTYGYGEFLAFGGSMVAFGFGVVVATILSKVIGEGQVAIADLPRLAHQKFDDLVKEFSRRLDLRH